MRSHKLLFEQNVPKEPVNSAFPGRSITQICREICELLDGDRKATLERTFNQILKIDSIGFREPMIAISDMWESCGRVLESFDFGSFEIRLNAIRIFNDIKAD